MANNKSAVLVCTCGKQLQLDYELIKNAVSKMKLAASVTVHDLVCQEEGLAKISELIDKHDGRVVIAACTNQKLQPRIDEYLKSDGKNSTQLQYVNIREHSAWVHENQEEATRKSIDMIRGVLARSAGSTLRQVEKKN
ncbi:MAG: hypothetical protein KAW94_07305, partial [Candidatus Thorarchaeota archaeon]|nr:hypothetical protein [Candidatus Thorarchaeota archaeon]